MVKKGNKSISIPKRGRPKKTNFQENGRGRPKKVLDIKTKETSNVSKKVELGKMSIDTEQMLKDLIELGRIRPPQPEEDKNNNKIKDSWELPKSPLSKFIDKKNSFYIKVASVFTLVVIIFFVSVLYVTNSKAVINIGLKNINTNGEIKKTVNVFSQKDSPENNNIVAVTANASLSLEDIYSDINVKQVGESLAIGKVKIYNNTSSPRDLVATTRFVSDTTSNLYRLKNNVRIPANSSIEADIYADNNTILGDEMGTRFTIPGLRSEVRQQIYGESIERIVVKTLEKKFVGEEDIKKANEILDVKLRQAAILKLKEQMAYNLAFDFAADTFDFKISNRKVSAKVGDEVNDFKVSATIEATSVFVDKTKILDLAKTNILSRSVSGSLVTIQEDTLEYKVENLDLIKKQMVLNIYVDFTSTFDVDSFLDKDDIVGMDIDDFYSYVSQKNFAINVNVVSYPFWNSKLPTIKDNITIRSK